MNELKNKSVGVGEHIQNKIHEYMKAGHKYLKGTGYDYQGLTKAYLKNAMNYAKKHFPTHDIDKNQYYDIVYPKKYELTHSYLNKL